jgi:hypothetical protein
MKALKLDDRPKAEALIQAAEQADYHVKLGLVTSYRTGELEINDSKKSSSRPGRRRSYYDDDYYDDNDDLTENGTMGEVYDEYVEINHWMEEGVPPLRNIEFDEMDLISPMALHEDEPVEKSAEGYTGNAGMEMQYWYHYGAVFLWLKKCQYDILTGLDTGNQLEWIDYYNRRWSTLLKADIDITKKLVEAGLRGKNLEEDTDFSPLADWLINLNDKKYFIEKGATVLADHFTRISVEKWIKLFETYPAACFENIFPVAANRGKAPAIRHLLCILTKPATHSIPSYKAFAAKQTEQVPDYLAALNLSAQGGKETAKDILRSLLQTDTRKVSDGLAWLKRTAEALTKDLTREYVNDVLVAEILAYGKKTNLAKRIMEICKADLERRVQAPPKPPADWSRPVPKNAGGYKEVWNILADFLRSPTQQILDYQSLQAKRKDMEHAIRSVTIDIEMETIRKGSPHTLRLIKTQDAYQRELAKWKKDAELLKKVAVW